MNPKVVTRADLTRMLHEQVGLSGADCADLLGQTLDLIVQALGQGEKVKLLRLGVFEVRSKGERLGRNPKTGAPATITPRRVVMFHASTALKARVGRAAST